MIIFGLDGTLADCRHRLHYIDPSLNDGYLQSIGDGQWYKKLNDIAFIDALKMGLLQRFKPDWKSFFKACDKDTPIEPVIGILYHLLSGGVCVKNEDIHIWSGRCESVREKTIQWLDRNLIDWNGRLDEHKKTNLKIRPIGDHRPEHELKEEWLKQALNECEKIEYVFEDNPRVIEMYRSHGIFVFDCNQEK